jgi:hypothetical protein
LVFACGGAIAQKDTGGLAGVVKDPSGAVVAGAKVRISDTQRGTELVTTTNAQGEFVVTHHKIGRYQLTVEKTGFKKTVAGPIIVNVDSRPSVDIVLSVGVFRKSSASPPRLHYWKRKLPIWGIEAGNRTISSRAQSRIRRGARDPRFIQFAMKFYF